MFNTMGVITDEIMQIIWDIQYELRNKIEKLEKEYNNGNIYESDYKSSLHILEAKMSVLDEVEDKLENYRDDD